jgi:very-short-patch-repair endonuclease
MRARAAIPDQLRNRPFTSQEALREGMTPSRLRGDDISHPFQGVHSGNAVETLLERCAALATKLPPYAYFCGATAASILGIPLPSAVEEAPDVHVGVPAEHRTLVGRGIRGHTYQTTDTHIHRPSGLVLSTPQRTWCELAARLTVTDLIVAGDHIVKRAAPLATLAQLSDAVTLNRDQRGTRKLRTALPRVNEASESPQESRVRLLLNWGQIEGWVANFSITTRAGHRYRADFAFPARRLILEYQSYFHEGTEKFRADMTRVSRLQADGWFVLLLNADDLRDPAELTQRIRSALARSRP